MNRFVTVAALVGLAFVTGICGNLSQKQQQEYARMYE